MEQLTLRQLLDAYHGQEAALKKYVRDYLPMFRDSDAQGLIGARAYLYYFQDMSTLHLHQVGKGNDTLPETYGAAWIYTKYKIKICRRADYTRPLHMETWIEKQDKLRIWQDLKISAGNETYALGRLESCVFHLDEQKSDCYQTSICQKLWPPTKNPARALCPAQTESVRNGICLYPHSPVF